MNWKRKEGKQARMYIINDVNFLIGFSREFNKYGSVERSDDDIYKMLNISAVSLFVRLRNCE